MGLICLVEEPGGRRTGIFLKTLSERFSEFSNVCFTSFDRDIFCFNSSGVFKGSQVLVFLVCKPFQVQGPLICNLQEF